MFIIYSTVKSQVPIGDRLLDFHNEELEDTARALALEDVVWEYMYINTDTAIQYALILHDFVQRIPDKKWTAYSNNTLGACYFDKGEYNISLEHYLNSLEYYEKFQIQRDIAGAKSNIAQVYLELENYDQGKIMLEEGIRICEEISDTQRLSELQLNYSFVLRELQEYEKAIENLLPLTEVPMAQKSPYFLTTVLLDLGAIYDIMNELDSALMYYEKALVSTSESNDLQGLTSIYTNIGIVFNKQKKYRQAIENCIRSLELAENASGYYSKQMCFMCLSNAYEGLRDFEQALIYNKLMEDQEDSILNESNIEEVTQLRLNFDFEKKRVIDSLKFFAKEQALKVNHSRKIEKEKQKRLILIISLALSVIVLLLAVYHILNKRKTNRLIIQKNEKIILQRDILEEKNKEITDSINSAYRIQKAILPTDRVVKEFLNDSFIFYRPKDIIAGDFYWLENVGSIILFAVADCTGHGVPGAMISVVCHNALNRSVREYQLTDPGQILNKTREIVIEQFEKSDEDVSDGMDIAFCALNGNKLSYAGAYNPVWICRKGANEIEEIKGDKQPIGVYATNTPYTTHTTELRSGDTIYIFSDGFSDQFGGEKGKKLKSANFKKLLLSAQDRSMGDQRIFIAESFEKWKGDLEQIDDVCVIGVRME